MARKFFVFGISMVIICLTLVGCKVNYELSGLGSFEGLDPKIELQIIKAYFGEDYKGQESIDKKIISDYLGTYGDCVAIRFGGWKFGMGPTWEINDEVLFAQPYGHYITIWKENKFYTLAEANEQEFLTKNDLEEINARDKEIYPELYDPNSEALKRWLEWYYGRKTIE